MVPQQLRLLRLKSLLLPTNVPKEDEQPTTKEIKQSNHSYMPNRPNLINNANFQKDRIFKKLDKLPKHILYNLQICNRKAITTHTYWRLPPFFPKPPTAEPNAPKAPISKKRLPCEKDKELQRHARLGPGDDSPARRRPRRLELRFSPRRLRRLAFFAFVTRFFLGRVTGPVSSYW